MMKRRKNKLYEYLEPFLNEGDESAIQEARKRYYRHAKAEWRRQRRREQKEYTVSFNQSELHEILAASKVYGKSTTQFIKQSALATCRSRILLPNEEVIRRIEALLIKNYCLFERIEEQLECHLSPEDLLTRFEILEKEINSALKPTVI